MGEGGRPTFASSGNPNSREGRKGEVSKSDTDWSERKVLSQSAQGHRFRRRATSAHALWCAPRCHPHQRMELATQSTLVVVSGRLEHRGSRSAVFPSSKPVCMGSGFTFCRHWSLDGTCDTVRSPPPQNDDSNGATFTSLGASRLKIGPPAHLEVGREADVATYGERVNTRRRRWSGTIVCRSNR